MTTAECHGSPALVVLDKSLTLERLDSRRREFVEQPSPRFGRYPLCWLIVDTGGTLDRERNWITHTPSLDETAKNETLPSRECILLAVQSPFPTVVRVVCWHKSLFDWLYVCYFVSNRPLEGD